MSDNKFSIKQLSEDWKSGSSAEELVKKYDFSSKRSLTQFVSRMRERHELEHFPLRKTGKRLKFPTTKKVLNKIIEMMNKDMSRKEIAKEFDISKSTLFNLMKRIREKYGSNIFPQTKHTKRFSYDLPTKN